MAKLKTKPDFEKCGMRNRVLTGPERSALAGYVLSLTGRKGRSGAGAFTRQHWSCLRIECMVTSHFVE
jgi:hypothetical protein